MIELNYTQSGILNEPVGAVSYSGASKSVTNVLAKVLIADDHTMFRRMMVEYLQCHPSVQLVIEAADGDEAFDAAVKHSPDVLLLDIEMPGLNSFDVVRRVRTLRSELRVIFLSAFVRDRYIEEVFSAGAAGFVSKCDSPDAIVNAIGAAMAGTTYYSPEVHARLGTLKRSDPAVDKRTPRSRMTPRELEVLRYIARGLSNKQISLQIGIALRTVDRHVVRLMARVNIHDRVNLARYAIREQIVEP